MALARVSFAVLAIALGCSHAQAAESLLGVDISPHAVVAHAGVTADEARMHAAELISEGQRLLQSINEYNSPDPVDEFDSPQFRSLGETEDDPVVEVGNPVVDFAVSTDQGIVDRRLSMGPTKGGWNPNQGNQPYYPGGTSIANAINVYGDAIADSEAARGGTSVANARTYQGTAIARSRSNRRLQRYYPGGQPYYPGGTSITNAMNVYGDAIADSEAARGGTSVANAQTYQGTAIARSRSNRRLQPYYPGGQPYYPGGTSIANAINVYGDAIADSEAARGGTSVANSQTYQGTSIARSRSGRRLRGE